MKKYWAFFKIALQNSLQYRIRGLIWLVWDVLPPVIMLFFWQAAFASQPVIAGYTISSMFIYYLLVMFIRAIVFTHPDNALQREIATGKMSSFYLIRPANVLVMKFFYELAYKVLSLFFIVPVIGIFLLLYPSSISSLHLSFLDITSFFIFISFTFVLTFVLRLIIGMGAFWFNDIDWIADLFDFLLLIFGGTLFPLQLLPKTLYTVSLYLPFRFEVFVPTQIFLGQFAGWGILRLFLIQLLWLGLFIYLAKIIWKKGLRIYSSYGG